MSNDWFKNLKVGDEVILIRGYYDVGRIVKVGHITPGGRKYIDGKQWDVPSRARGARSALREGLKEATTESREKIERHELINRIANVSGSGGSTINKITLDQLRRMNAILDEVSP